MSAVVESALFPHLPYMDAVVAALDEVGLAPSRVEAGITDLRALSADFVFTPDNPAVKDSKAPRGLRLMWRHITGWWIDDATATDHRHMPLPTIADPAEVVTALRDAAARGLRADGRPTRLHQSAALWQHHQAFEVHLSDWEDHS